MQLTKHLNVVHSQQNAMLCFLNDQIEHIALKKCRCSTEIKVNRISVQMYNDTSPDAGSHSNRHSDKCFTLTREVAVDGFEEGGSL